MEVGEKIGKREDVIYPTKDRGILYIKGRSPQEIENRYSEFINIKHHIVGAYHANNHHYLVLYIDQKINKIRRVK